MRISCDPARSLGDFPQMKPEYVIQLARAAGLVKYKGDILEILLHSSDVLAIVPKGAFDTYGPIIHDALLAFLDGLPDERIVDRALRSGNGSGRFSR